MAADIGALSMTFKFVFFVVILVLVAYRVTALTRPPRMCYLFSTIRDFKFAQATAVHRYWEGK